MMSALLLAATVAAGADKPATTAKVVPPSAILYESPEMRLACETAIAQSLAHAGDAKEAKARRDADEKAAREAYHPAAKPIEELSPDELAQWKGAKKKLEADLQAIDDRYAAEQSAALKYSHVYVDRLCAQATTATLSMGTTLAVLEKNESMMRVRVESGRSTGLAGWVTLADVQ